MLANLTGWHLVAVLIIVLVIFGGAKLPGLAKSLGQSMKIFRSEVKDLRSDDEKRAAATTPAAPDAAAQGSVPVRSDESRPTT